VAKIVKIKLNLLFNLSFKCKFRIDQYSKVLIYIEKLPAASSLTQKQLALYWYCLTEKNKHTVLDIYLQAIFLLTMPIDNYTICKFISNLCQTITM